SRLGVDRLTGASIARYSFVRRDDVRKALGIAQCPDRRTGDTASTFWAEFRVRSSAQVSQPRLTKGSLAVLRSSDLKTVAQVVVDWKRDQVKFEISCTAASAPRRYRRIRAQLRLLKSAWPTMVLEDDPASGSIAMHETRSFPELRDM